MQVFLKTQVSICNMHYTYIGTYQSLRWVNICLFTNSKNQGKVNSRDTTEYWKINKNIEAWSEQKTQHLRINTNTYEENQTCES